ncbi:MerR family transcriptional regulator [Deinococcus oregonensis]|uniref:MerR family transcriptional regulator n=1 Tax=Deinococcus oregonensis TaxID=1805970 RepID=A0ABV6B6L4_9DEIO
MLLKIGEVAQRTGLCTRTLRHYDTLGLLHPSSRSDSHYQLYTPSELQRLLQIQT